MPKIMLFPHDVSNYTFQLPNVVILATLDYGRLDGVSAGIIRDDALEITTY